MGGLGSSKVFIIDVEEVIGLIFVGNDWAEAVSYTHLTLPTSDLV